jgi:hypothetical protein
MRRALALLLLAVWALAACGVGPQQRATVIPSGELPSLEQSPSAPPSSTPPSATPTPSPVTPSPSELSSPAFVVPSSTLYLVSNAALVGEFRPRTQTATLPDLLRALLRGPTDAEASRGISTAINTSPDLLGVIVQDGVATVDLSGTFGDIRAPDQVLATAQVVMTAASFPGVDSVQISLDGKAAQMPLADGTLSWSPLTFADYASLLAGASPTS